LEIPVLCPLRLALFAVSARLLTRVLSRGRLKTQFEMANDVKHKGLYAKELLPVLEGLESDMDRNIQRTKVRLTQEMPAIQDPKTTGKIQEIMEQIKGFQADIERYGEEGEVDKAEDANKKVALLIGEKERIEKAELDPYGQREKTQTICEVCGNIAQSTDNEQRKQNHLEGKQHKGFVAIRAAIPELRDMIEAARAADPDFDKDGSARGGPDAIAAQPSDRERRREDAPRDDDRRRDRSRERRDRSRSRDRKRDRSGERDRYRSSRDYRGSDRTRDDYRSSDRDRRRDRSRSRDRRR